MKKIRLDVDALAVESFVLPAHAVARGTVRANSEPYTHKDEYTCGNSCLAPCRHTMEVPGCGMNTDFGCI